MGRSVPILTVLVLALTLLTPQRVGAQTETSDEQDPLTQEQLDQVTARIKDNLLATPLTIEAIEYDASTDQVVIRMDGVNYLWVTLADALHADGLSVPRNNIALDVPLAARPGSPPYQQERDDQNTSIGRLGGVLVFGLAMAVVLLAILLAAEHRNQDPIRTSLETSRNGPRRASSKELY